MVFDFEDDFDLEFSSSSESASLFSGFPLREYLTDQAIDQFLEDVFLPLPVGENKALLVARVEDVLQVLKRTESIEYLVGGVASDPQFKRSLYIVVKLSKIIYNDFPEIASLASSAITILNQANESFSQMKLSGVQVPNASLVSALMYATDLSYANLSGVNAKSSVFDAANLSNANLTDLFLGEEPIFTAGEDEPITSIAFSSTGELLVAGTDRGHIHFWDFVSRDKPFALEGTEGKVFQGRWMGDPVKSVCFSPDDKWLASGGGFYIGGDTTIRIWDIETRQVIRKFEYFSEMVHSLSFHPSNSNWVAACGDKNLVMILDIATGNPTHQFIGYEKRVNQIAFDHSGEFLLTASDEAEVGLWDLDTRQKKHHFQATHKGRVFSFALSPDGKFLASGDESRIDFWNFRTRELLSSIETASGSKDLVASIDISPDGHWVAASTFERKIYVWNPRERGQIYLLSSESQPSVSIKFHPSDFSNHKYLLSVGLLSGVVKSWEFGRHIQENISRQRIAHSGSMTGLSYKSSNNSMASMDSNAVVFWRVAANSMGNPFRISNPPGRLTAISLHPTSSIYAVGTEAVASSENAKVYLCHRDSPGDLQVLNHQGARAITQMDFSPGGELLAVASSVTAQDGLSLWRISDSSHVRFPFPADNAQGYHCVKFNADGSLLAAGDRNHVTTLWRITDLKSTEKHSVFKDHKNHILNLAFSADNKWFASAALDEVLLYQLKKGVLYQKIPLSTRALAFNPASTLLALGTYASISFWNLSANKLSGRLFGHSDTVSGLCFSANNRLISASWDGVLRLWDLVIKEGKLLSRLLWVSQSGESALRKINISDAQGLSRKNRKLLEQYGALDDTQEWLNSSKKQFSEVAGLNSREEPSTHLKEVKRVLDCREHPSIPVEVGDPTVNFVFDLTLSNDERWLALGMKSDRLWLYNIASKEYFILQDEQTKWGASREIKKGVRIVDGRSEGSVLSVDFSSDDAMLVSGGADGWVSTWSVQERRRLHRAEGHSKGVHCVTVHPNKEKHWVASSSEDGTIRLWEADPAGVLRSLQVITSQRACFWDVRFSSSGIWLAVIDFATIRLWNVENFEVNNNAARVLHDPARDRILCLAFHPNGEQLAWGPGNINRNEKSVRLWSMKENKIIATFKGPKMLVRRIAFDGEGKWLLAGSYDNAIYLWSTLTQALKKVIKFNSDTRGLTFFSGNRRFAAVGQDNVIRQFEIYAALEEKKKSSVSGFKSGFFNRSKAKEEEAAEANKTNPQASMADGLLRMRANQNG